MFFPWIYFGTPLDLNSLVSISCQIYFLLRNCHQVACPVNQQRQFLAQSGQLVATLEDKEWTIGSNISGQRVDNCANIHKYTNFNMHILIAYNMIYSTYSIQHSCYLDTAISIFVNIYRPHGPLSVISTQYTYKASLRLLATET